MIDEEAARLEARLLAMEYLIAEAFRMAYLEMGAPPETIKQSHQNLRNRLLTMKMPPSDPAISDLAAWELQQAFGRMLLKIEESALGQRKSE